MASDLFAQVASKADKVKTAKVLRYTAVLLLAVADSLDPQKKG